MYRVGKLFQRLGVCAFVALKRLHHMSILARATETHAEIFEFGLDSIQTKTIGKRSIEIVGLTGNLHLFVGTHALKRAHIVKTVGKFDENGTDVILHRVKHLLEIVELLTEHILILLLLSDNIDQKRDIIAKHFLDFFDSVVSILHHIMEKRCDDSVGVEHKFSRHNLSHLYRVDNVGLTRFAFLLLVGFIGKQKCAFDALQVFIVHTSTHHIEYVIHLLSSLFVVISFHAAKNYLSFHRTTSESALI